MVALASSLAAMSVGEFLAWEPADGLAWQLVDGVPQAMAPASPAHGAIRSQLARLIGNHLDRVDSPCTVVVTPGVVPNVRSSRNVRIPDLAVTCMPVAAQASILSDPVLIIEVISPGNRAETWQNVWSCITIPSVREIVVMDSLVVAAEILRRGSDGTWPRDTEAVTGDALWLDSLGLSIPMAAIYRHQTPGPRRHMS